MTQPRLTLGTHLPRKVRRNNLRWMRRMQARDAQRQANEAARAFWERCFNGLMEVLQGEVEERERTFRPPVMGQDLPEVELPKQELVDAVMARVGVLPLTVQAKYAGMPDDKIVAFMREVLQREREGWRRSGKAGSVSSGGRAPSS